MKTSSRNLVVLASLIVLTLTGCGVDLTKQGTTIGTINAGIVVPELPLECRKVWDHAAIHVSDEARSIIKRERSQLNQANGTIKRCAANYDHIKSGEAEKRDKVKIPQ